MTKIWDIQVLRNNLTFYPNCKVLVDMQFTYFWNSRNLYDDQIDPTIGIPEIGMVVKIVHISGIQKIVVRHIFGIPLVGTFFTN